MNHFMRVSEILDDFFFIKGSKGTKGSKGSWMR